MNWEALGAIAELVGAVGVIATLGYLAIQIRQNTAVVEQLEWGPIGRTALRSVTVVLHVMARCSRMHKRWPWSEFEPYRPVALRELRHEYGIQVLTVD